MRWPALVLALACWWTAAAAQTLEEWIEAAPDPESLQQWLDDLREQPLDLNRAAVEEITQLPLFDRAAAQRMVTLRELRGGFRDVRETAAAELTPGQREVLREFTVAVAPTPGRTSAYVTAGRVEGGAWWGRARADFAHTDGARGYVYGVHPAGEAELADELSLGCEWSSQAIPLRAVAGEFQIESSTGLVFASSFGTGQWLAARQATRPREPAGLKVKPTRDRRVLFRGAAVEYAPSSLRIIAVASAVPLDAAVGSDGIERITEGNTSAPELAAARSDRLEERAAGLSMEWSWSTVRLSANGARSWFSSPLRPGDGEGTGWPRLAGDRLDAGSIGVTYERGAVLAVSEVAASRPGGTAHQSLLSIRQGGVDFALYHVYAAPDFHSLHSRLWGGFGEEARNARVTGVRVHTALARHSLAVGAAAERSPFREATSALRRTSGELDAVWAATLPARSFLSVLVSRRVREETRATQPTSWVRLDRMRMEARVGDEEFVRVKFEVRSAAEDRHSDRELGTLLQVQSGIPAWRGECAAWLTFFHLDGDHVATSIYERVPVGSYPLAALSGTGRRAGLMFSRRWGEIGAALRLAHTRGSTSGRVRSELEFALHLSYHRT